MRFSSPKRRQGIRDHGNIAMLVGFLLGPDDNCIDVGANHGYVLERAVHAAPLGHHVAYEPIPQLAEQLRRRFPSADVRNAAVSDAAGVMPFHFVRTEDGLSGLHNVDFDGRNEVETLDVPVEVLDQALPTGYVPRLIKIDVEGAEYGVVSGAIETIREHQPAVMFEFWPEAAATYGVSASQMYDLVCDRAGLRLFDMDANGPYGRDEFERVTAEGVRENFLAHR